MAEVQQVEERARPTSPTSAPGENRRDLDRARAFLVAGLAWAAVVVLAWLVWWLIGDAGRESLARTVGLSATQAAAFVVVSLILEKLAAKGLLFAALYHWIKSRSPRSS